MTMNFQEIPSAIPGQKTWGAHHDGQDYLILEDEGLFTASTRMRKGNRAHTIFLIPYDDPVSSFDAAARVCMAYHRRRYEHKKRGPRKTRPSRGPK